MSRMRGHFILRGLAPALLVTIAVALAGAQTGPREDLQRFVQQLQASPNDDALRTRVIQLALSLEPRPAIPEEAERRDGRAEYAFRNAKTPADYEAAAQEYRKAIEAAPWVDVYYYNLGKVLQQLERHNEAIWAFHFYLTAAPAAEDARDVRKLIAGLEFAAEKATQEQQAAAEERRRTERAQQERLLALQSVSGLWRCDRCDDAAVVFEDGRFHALVSQKKKNIPGASWGSAYDERTESWGDESIVRFEGTLVGERFAGTTRFPKYRSGSTGCEVPMEEQPFTAELSADGTRLSISTRQSNYETTGKAELMGLVTTCQEVKEAGSEPLRIVLERDAKERDWTELAPLRPANEHRPSGQPDILTRLAQKYATTRALALRCSAAHPYALYLVRSAIFGCNESELVWSNMYTIKETPRVESKKNGTLEVRGWWDGKIIGQPDPGHGVRWDYVHKGRSTPAWLRADAERGYLFFMVPPPSTGQYQARTRYLYVLLRPESESQNPWYTRLINRR